MKLPIAAAALFLAATAVMPAFAAARAPSDSAVFVYPNGYYGYAVAPGFQNQATAWGHCVRGESSTTSAYPSWDVCHGR